MTRNPDTRQALYDRIRESSTAEVILEEMIRLGFWPERGQLPADPADEIRSEGELERQLRALRSEAARLGDLEKIKREARRRRFEAARQRRQETKQKRLRERAERRTAWARKKAADITYLGAGVSGGLGERASDAARLARHELPVLSTPAELAAAMEISVRELRFLAFHRPVSRTTHYARFEIPKKTGGTRLISAPMPRLKAAQRWILETILEPLPLHEAAHGFRAGRSIVTAARPHVGAAVVVNVDLRDFFPSFGYRRVRGMFRSLGYSEAVATLLALLCTEPEIEATELDGDIWYVATSERALPQGAPSSPAITNRICRRLDHRLTVAAKKLGYGYTRYADDLTFSSPLGDAVGALLRQVAHAVAGEGLEIHPDKTRVFRRGRRQEVTGLVVNDKLSVPRAELRRLRAALYQIEKDGPEGKRWGKSADPISGVLGYASFVSMVDPERGRPLLERARKLAAKHRPAAAAPAPEPGPKGKKWWKLF